MSFFKKMGKNWAKNTKSKALGETGKKAGWTVLGGMLYTLFPTAIQGWAGIDMSGAKGVAAGAVGSSLVGILADKKEIVAGGIATAGIHLTYNHFNGVITGIFGSPIFGYDPTAVTHTDERASEAMSTNDGLPEGYIYNSRGEIEAVDPNNDLKALEQGQPVNDFTNELSDYTTDLRDYGNAITVEPDFLNSFMAKELKAFGLN